MDSASFAFFDQLNDDADIDFDTLIKHRPTGVDIVATQANWPALLEQVPEAPRTFEGARPSKSPSIWRFCPGGFDNQWIGMCVGKGGRNACGTIVRIPDNATEASTPLPTVAFSGLFAYFNARKVARKQGIRLGGAGAIVSHLMLALQDEGIVTEDWYPDSQAAQNAYSDSRPPKSSRGDIYVEGSNHQLLQAARITSAEQYLEFLAAGYPIVDGVPIGQGWMQTADDGKFSLGGRNVGGHCTVTVGYDETTDKLFKRNSWTGWGARTDDPEFAAAGKRNNIGYCSLQQYIEQNLSAAAFKSGQTDAFVVNTLEGFEKPKIKPISARETL